MNHSKQILKLRLTRAAQQTQQHHRAAESRPLRDAHEGDYVLLLVSDTDLTPKGMKTPHFIVYVLWQPSEWNFVEQWKLHHWSFFLSQPSMIDWSNSRELRGWWLEWKTNGKEAEMWLTQRRWWDFFFFPCFLSGVFVCRKPLNMSEACWECTSLFILFCLPVLFFIMTSSDSLLSCKFPMTCTV